MSLMNRIKESMKQLNQQTGSKFTYEEQVFENGELHVKRVVKHGEEADKEIQKHLPAFSGMMSEFLKKFWS